MSTGVWIAIERLLINMTIISFEMYKALLPGLITSENFNKDRPLV